MENNKFFFTRSYILLLALTVYYFGSPFVFFSDNFISNKGIFVFEFNFISDSNKIIFYFYNFFSIIFLALIFYYLKKIIFIKKKKEKNYNYFDFVFLFLLIASIILIIIDLYNLIIYFIDNYPINRSLLYYAVLDKRNTHINILIIVATASLNKYKFTSLLGIVLLIAYSILSYSRIELVLLFSILFCIHRVKKENQITFYSFCLSIIIIIVFYRFFLSSQNIFYILIDPLHLSINTFNLIENYNFNDLSFILLENVKYIFKDFFYINFQLENFFESKVLPTYSKRGIDTAFIYIIPLIFYLFIFKSLNKYFFVSKNLNHSIFIFLIISLFRGDFVHNIGFIIKLYILVLILEWLIRMIKLYLLKGV